MKTMVRQLDFAEKFFATLSKSSDTVKMLAAKP